MNDFARYDMSNTTIVMNEKEAAEYIGMSLSFLQHDRCYGVIGNKTAGPIFMRMGRSVRYLKNDLDNWLLQHRVCREN